MLDIDFATMTDQDSMVEVLAMMVALYSEDEPASVVDHGRFPLTIECLIREPSRGRIILFTEGTSLRGYALLIPYWSNEFGGTLLFVDELFVSPEARRRGIGRRFFEYIVAQRPFDAVAVGLEVSPGNTRARALYESMGFALRRNVVLTRRLRDLRPGAALEVAISVRQVSDSAGFFSTGVLVRSSLARVLTSLFPVLAKLQSDSG